MKSSDCSIIYIEGIITGCIFSIVYYTIHAFVIKKEPLKNKFLRLMKKFSFFKYIKICKVVKNFLLLHFVTV